MSKIKFPSPHDYVKAMTGTSKNLYYLWGLKFINQRFIGGYYEGKFKFNFKNPLVWLLMFLIFIFLLIGGFFDMIAESIKELRRFISEGVTVELDQDYDKKDCYETFKRRKSSVRIGKTS